MKAYLDYKSSGVEWLGEVPSHWEVCPIRNIFKFRNEKNDPVKTENILSLSIANGVTEYTEENRGGNKRKDDLTAYKLAYPNDIVLNSMNVIVGAVGRSNFFGAISPVYYALYLHKNDDIHFYEYVFSNAYFQRGLLRYGKGILIKKSDSGKLNTIRMKISQDDLKSLFFPRPPLAEQQKIAQFLDTKTAQIDALITEQNRLIELLTEQRKAVISHAVTKGLNPNAPMKKSGVEWLGEVPSGWQVGKIKHFATVNPKIKKFSLPENEMIEFIPMANVDDVLGVISDFEYRNFGEVSTGYTAFNSNDVVFAKITPCMENGNCAIIPNLKFNFGFGSTEFIVFRVKKEIMPEFLHLILRNDYLRKICKRFMSGVAGQQRISTEFLADYPVAIPPLAEQNEIVAYIETQTAQIDALISEQKRLIERLKEYRTALISAAVTGKIDVQAA